MGVLFGMGKPVYAQSQIEYVGTPRDFQAAVQAGVPSITTIQAAEAVVKALEALRDADLSVVALQDRFAMA